MKERTTRDDTIRSISAIGAGVLLAATPHCGGKSEGQADESNEKGGASGSAGTYGGHGGVGQPGGYGGSYAGNFGPGVPPPGGYGGSYGGSFAGAVGLGGNAGSCPMGVIQRCWSPGELLGCAGSLDAGVDVIVVDGGDDPGEGGAAGAAAEVPEPAAPDSGSGAVPPPPEGFACPSGPPFPQCVMSTNPPPGGFPSVIGWNGSQCCYAFYTCY